MKVLLDENLPRRLKALFWPDIEAKSARDMGWNGKCNGELLGLMTINGFDVFITVDRNLSQQQNLPRFPLTVFLLRAIKNDYIHLAPLIKRVRHQLTTPLQPGLIEIRPDA